MIPDEKTAKMLWDTYDLPHYKRIHCAMVAKVAQILAQKIQFQSLIHHSTMHINEQLLYAASLLHDIDKNVEKQKGEHHPDAGVRILKEGGMDDVAEVIRTHPLHTIIYPSAEPKTIEQQILFIADKMTKQTCIGLEARFNLWRQEDMDADSQEILVQSYPKVLALRDTLLEQAGISENELISLTK
jgi:putative nucleotidyltransferase with HDIG domain